MTQEQQISGQRTQIASLEKRAGAGAGALMAGAPGVLEILEPRFVAMRGRNTAVVRGVGKSKLLGRVSNPKAIAQLTVNGSPRRFPPTVPSAPRSTSPPGGTMVKVAAVDKQGGRAQLDFTMVPQAGGAVASAMTASVRANRRLAARPEAGPLPRRGDRQQQLPRPGRIRRSRARPAMPPPSPTCFAIATATRPRCCSTPGRLEMLSALDDMRKKLARTTAC